MPDVSTTCFMPGFDSGFVWDGHCRWLRFKRQQSCSLLTVCSSHWVVGRSIACWPIVRHDASLRLGGRSRRRATPHDSVQEGSGWTAALVHYCVWCCGSAVVVRVVGL